MNELLKNAYEYGRKYEISGGHEDYSFEEFLTDYAEALQLQQTGVIKSLPESDEIRMKAQELDEKDFDQWWWETVYKGNVL